MADHQSERVRWHDGSRGVVDAFSASAILQALRARPDLELPLTQQLEASRGAFVRLCDIIMRNG